MHRIALVVVSAVCFVACTSERRHTTDAEALDIRDMVVNMTGQQTLSHGDHRELGDLACDRTDGAVDYADVAARFGLDRDVTDGDPGSIVWLATTIACPELDHDQPGTVGVRVDRDDERIRSDDPPAGFPDFVVADPVADALGYQWGDLWLLSGPATVEAVQVIDHFVTGASDSGWITTVYGPFEHLGGRFWSVDLAIDGFEGALEVLDAGPPNGAIVFLAIGPRARS